MTGPDPTPSYDLLIRGGTVIDPAAGLRGERDVAIVAGRIAAVEPSLPADRATQSLDASGKLVLPGLIDLHTHLFWGLHGADPEQACLARGTTTALDAGSTGAYGFRALQKFIIATSRVRMQAWLNISTIGLIDTRVGELLNLAYLDVDEAVSMAETHRATIVGFKVRISNYVAGSDFKPALKLARQAADAARLPMMVHIGDTNEPLSVALSFLRPGDVVTHSLTGRRHGLLDPQGRLLPAVREARQAGVHFDGAHGRNHFGFATVRRLAEQGFLVDTLSTDISEPSAADPSFHLPQIMSKLLACGLSLDVLVPLVTSSPARYLKRAGELGTLRPGAVGDVAILELQEGDFTLRDNEGQSLQTRQRLRPWRTVRAGEVVEPPAAS
jgi:dihydroorotase